MHAFLSQGIGTWTSYPRWKMILSKNSMIGHNIIKIAGFCWPFRRLSASNSSFQTAVENVSEKRYRIYNGRFSNRPLGLFLILSVSLNPFGSSLGSLIVVTLATLLRRCLELTIWCLSAPLALRIPPVWDKFVCFQLSRVNVIMSFSWVLAMQQALTMHIYIYI